MRGALAIAVVVAACDYHGRYDALDAHGDGLIDATVDGGGDDDASIADATVDATPDAVPDARPDARPDAGPDAAMCPSDYVPIAGAPSRYRTIAGFSSWTDAEHDCEDDGTGTHLVVIDDAAESAAVDDLIFGNLWLGASDRVTEGSFLAVTGGAAPYLAWGPFQPDDFFGQDCVSMNEAGNYADAGCDSARGYVCECDGIAPDPASY